MKKAKVKKAKKRTQELNTPKPESTNEVQPLNPQTSNPAPPNLGTSSFFESPQPPSLGSTYNPAPPNLGSSSSFESPQPPSLGSTYNPAPPNLGNSSSFESPQPPSLGSTSNPAPPQLLNPSQNTYLEPQKIPKTQESKELTNFLLDHIKELYSIILKSQNLEVPQKSHEELLRKCSRNQIQFELPEKDNLKLTKRCVLCKDRKSDQSLECYCGGVCFQCLIATIHDESSIPVCWFCNNEIKIQETLEYTRELELYLQNSNRFKCKGCSEVLPESDHNHCFECNSGQCSRCLIMNKANCVNCDLDLSPEGRTFPCLGCFNYLPLKQFLSKNCHSGHLMCKLCWGASEDLGRCIIEGCEFEPNEKDLYCECSICRQYKRKFMGEMPCKHSVCDDCQIYHCIGNNSFTEQSCGYCGN